MSTGKDSEAEHPTVEDLQEWLAEEVRNCKKECELRVREATEFTTAYAMGKLTPEEAHARLRKYDQRWSSPLEGILASSYESDEEILSAIDKDHESLRQRYRRNPNRDDIQR